MAEKVNILELNIDTDALTASMVELKKEIKDLADSQKELRSQGRDTEETFVTQEAKLKALRTEYNSQVKVLNQVVSATTGAEAAYKTQAKSIDEAANQNKVLREAVKHLNTSTIEGLNTLQAYNQKINENSAFIKENSDTQIKGYMTVGQYKNEVRGALEELNPFNLAIRGMTGGIKEAGGVMPFLRQGLMGAVSGVRALTTASLAFIATPIGAIVSVIAAAFLLMKNAINSNEESMNQFKEALAPVMAVLDVFMSLLSDIGIFLVDTLTKAFKNPEQAIKDLGKAIVDNVINRFKALIGMYGALGRGLMKLMKGDFRGAVDEAKNFGNSWVDAMTGVEDSVDKVGDKLTEMKEDAMDVAEASRELVRVQEELVQAERDFALATSENRAEQERLKNITRDMNISLEERQKATKELEEAQKSQLEREIALRQKNVEAVRLEIRVNGESTELLDKLNDAQIKLNDAMLKGEQQRNSLIRAQRRSNRSTTETIESTNEEIDAQSDRYKELSNSVNEYRAKVADLDAYIEGVRITKDEGIIDENEYINKLTDNLFKRYELIVNYYDKIKKDLSIQLGEGLISFEDFKKEMDNIDNLKAQSDRFVLELSNQNQKFTIPQEIKETFQELFNLLSPALKELNSDLEDLTDQEQGLITLGGVLENISDRLWVSVSESENRFVVKNGETVLTNLKDLNRELLEGIESYNDEVSAEIEKILRDNNPYTAIEGIYNDSLENLKGGFEEQLMSLNEHIVLTVTDQDKLNAFSDVLVGGIVDSEGNLSDEYKEYLQTTLPEAYDQVLELERLNAENKMLINEQYYEDLAELRARDEIDVLRAYRESIDLAMAEVEQKTALYKGLNVVKRVLALADWTMEKNMFIAKKSASAGEATADIAKGEAKTLASAPFPFNIPLYLGFLAQTAGIVAAIKGVKTPKDPKFEKGGAVLRGRRHYQGGIPINAEDGEIILTRGVYNNPMLRNMASRINELGGGVSFSTGSNMGDIGRSSGFINYDLLASKISVANSSLPSPVVRVSDIDSVTTHVNVIDSMTSF